MYELDEQRFERVLMACLLAIAAGAAVDVYLDAPRTLWTMHIVFELALVAFSLAAVAWLGTGWRRTRSHLERTRRQLAGHARERDAWRVRAETVLRGLGEEIDRQLRDWELTPAERETALLLLKGFGHKEIAALQDKSERTVRQHAVAVYRKSGLSGRAELSAFFLEDLLLPAAQRGNESVAEDAAS